MATCRFFRPIASKVSVRQAEALGGVLSLAYNIGVTKIQNAISKHSAQVGKNPVKPGGNLNLEPRRHRF